MLTTSSPIISSATTNASPRAFQYYASAAASGSPHTSPRRPAPAAPRRQSSATSRSSQSQPQSQPQSRPPSQAQSHSRSPSVPPMTAATATASAPAQHRRKHYVTADAGTQYSPLMVAGPPPTLPPTLAMASSPASINDAPAEPPPRPVPQPLDALQPAPAAAAIASPTMATEGNTISPGKRRPSSGQDDAERVGSSPASLTPSSPSKRPRQADGPPKVLPQGYEHCAIEDMVILIAHMLSELIETNDSLALRSGSLTRFHSRTAPGISVLDYLNRLAKHATLTPPLLLSMVYYIDRLCALYPEFTINTLTVHRFLITAATVAAKGLSDSFWNNSTYAKVGGVRLAELKMLELEFLYRVDWKIVPNPEILVAYYKGLVERCPGYSIQGGQGSGGELEDGELDSDDPDDSDVSDEFTPAEGSEEQSVNG